MGDSLNVPVRLKYGLEVLSKLNTKCGLLNQVYLIEKDTTKWFDHKNQVVELGWEEMTWSDSLKHFVLSVDSLERLVRPRIYTTELRCVPREETGDFLIEICATVNQEVLCKSKTSVVLKPVVVGLTQEEDQRFLTVDIRNKNIQAGVPVGP